MDVAYRVFPIGHGRRQFLSRRSAVSNFLVAIGDDVKFDQTSSIKIFGQNGCSQPPAPRTIDRVDERVPLIEARGLTKQFGGLRAVDGMSIALRRGEMLGLIGPNGAGKTTLFNLLAGSLKPTAGTISDRRPASCRGEGPEARIARGVGRTFQIPRPFAEMTVLENVLTGGQRPGGRAHLDEFPAARPRRRAGEGGGREGARRCSTSSRCRRSKASRRACCRAASASCWSWRAS